jgi:hypothetical protein
MKSKVKVGGNEAIPPKPPVFMALMAALLVAGCSKPMKVQQFKATTPAFDPLTFWTGHTHSWGVIENRAGAPTEIVQTDCQGNAEGPNALHMRQTLTESDGTITHRDWHLRRTAPGHFEATANDMVGTAHGDAAGRAFHWDWVWAAGGSNPLKHVTMHQWMYLMPDGTMMNRTVVTKLGVTLAQVSEQFSRAP